VTDTGTTMLRLAMPSSLVRCQPASVTLTLKVSFPAKPESGL
jgi:hypothetical protein